MLSNNKFLILLALVGMFCMFILSGCEFTDNIAVKLNFKNDQFEYIKENRVDKIIIQNVRDSGFRFIVNDPSAIEDVYNMLSKGREVSEKSSLDPDYIFEIWIGDEVKKYEYVVGANERSKGNFYDDEHIFSISKNLDNTIMQNLSFIRKPRDFEYVYYQSILKVIELKKQELSDNNVGIDISGDVDCLKYMFSMELEEFKKNLRKQLPSVDLVKNNQSDFDAVIKVKNRGYNSTLFKTLITVEDKKDKVYENYYITAEYNYKDWDINISDPNQKPDEW